MFWAMLALDCAVFGQAPADKPAVIGILNYVHAVTDLDKTVAFYKDVIGLEFSRPPAAFPNPGVPLLVNSPGVTLRLATMKMPGQKYVLELTQFSAADRKAGQPMPTDPGAASLHLMVRDIDPIFDLIKKSGAPIITKSGAPVKVGADMRSLMLRDPDGYIVEVIQSPAAPDAPAGNVHSVIMGLTVGDLAETQKFYHEMLGFDLASKMEFAANSAVTDVVAGPEGMQARRMAGNIPGTSSRVEFYEFKGMPRTKFHLRVFDPGAPALVLRVNDLDGMLKRLRALGTEVLSAKGEVVQFSADTRNIFVVDPNGVNLELFERHEAAKK